MTARPPAASPWSWPARTRIRPAGPRRPLATSSPRPRTHGGPGYQALAAAALAAPGRRTAGQVRTTTSASRSTTSTSRRPSGAAVTAAAPAPPPLDDGLEQLLRRMRLPHMRRIAPEVLATAKAQRWDPAEVLRALLAEEVAGRDRSSLATRRARAAFPTGKTFDAWDERLSSVPAPTQAALRTLEWVGRHENLVVCGPSGTGKTFLLEALGQAAVEAGQERRLVHPRAARRPGPRAPRRRLRHQGHRPHPARRPRRRRPMPTPRLCRGLSEHRWCEALEAGRSSA